MSTKTVFIRTAADGSYSWQRLFRGTIAAIEFQIGDLSTPDIDVTDETYAQTFLSVNGVAADTTYYPNTFREAADGTSAALAGTGVKVGAPAVCMGELKVAITGGGDTKSGKVIIQYY